MSKPWQTGKVIAEFVNSVSHGRGKTLGLMKEASITLQQLLVLARLQKLGSLSASELAHRMNMSLPSISQMIERLVVMGYAVRSEDVEDRRRIGIRITQRGGLVLQRIAEARAEEFELGISGLSPGLRKDLVQVLKRAMRELREESL